jgi:hypothetical protein
MVVSALNLLRAGLTILAMTVVRRGEHQDLAPAKVPGEAG